MVAITLLINNRWGNGFNKSPKVCKVQKDRKIKWCELFTISNFPSFGLPD